MERLSSEILQHIVDYLPKLKQHQFIDDTRFGILCCNSYYSVVAIASWKTQHCPPNNLMPIFSDLEIFRRFLSHYWFFTPSQIIFDDVAVFQAFMKIMRDVYFQCRLITINVEPDDLSQLRSFDLNRFPKVTTLSMKKNSCGTQPRFSDFQCFGCLKTLECEVSGDGIVPDLPKLRNLVVNRLLDYSQLNLRKLVIKSNDTTNLNFNNFPRNLSYLELKVPAVEGVSFPSSEFPDLKTLKISLNMNSSYPTVNKLLIQMCQAPRLKTISIELKGLEIIDQHHPNICELPFVEHFHLSNDGTFPIYKYEDLQHIRPLFFTQASLLKVPVLRAPLLKTLVLELITINAEWKPPATLESLELKGVQGTERIDLSFLPLLRILELTDVNFTDIKLPQSLTNFKMRGCRLELLSCPQNLKVLNVALYENQEVDFNNELEELTLIQYEFCRIIETNFINKLQKLLKFNFRSWELGVNYNLNKIRLPESLCEFTITGIQLPSTFPLRPNLFVRYVNLFDLC